MTSVVLDLVKLKQSRSFFPSPSLSLSITRIEEQKEEKRERQISLDHSRPALYTRSTFRQGMLPPPPSFAFTAVALAILLAKKPRLAINFRVSLSPGTISTR